MNLYTLQKDLLLSSDNICALAKQHYTIYIDGFWEWVSEVEVQPFTHVVNSLVVKCRVAS